MDNDIVTVSQNAIDLVPPTYQTIPLSAGEQVPLLDLISVMLIRSGNEAANAIAEFLSGSVESFADLMNQTAQMLGCSSSTHFANPSGVHDENHYTTARDLAIIAQACMKDERFAAIVSQTSYDMPATQTEAVRPAIPGAPSSAARPSSMRKALPIIAMRRASRRATRFRRGTVLSARRQRRHQSHFRRAL